MDLLNTSFSTIKINSLQSRVNDIVNNLQQAGLFRAIVLESKGNKVIVDTAFGQLKGTVPDKLSRGDELLVRLLPGKTDSFLKIEQIQTARQALPEKILNQLIKISKFTAKNNTSNTISIPGKTSTPAQNSSISAQAIKVLGHSAEKTLLQLNHKTYSIPRQPLLQTGETLLLKATINNKIELLRIQPETILKNALSNLLPRIASNENKTELSSIHKLATNFLKLKLTDTTSSQASSKKEITDLQTILNRVEKKLTNKLPDINRPLNRTDSKVKMEPTFATTNSAENSSIKKLAQPSSSTDLQREIPVRVLKQLFSTLSQPLARVDNFKPDSLQQILSMLTLVKPIVPGITSKTYFSIPDNLVQLHQSINNSPENFKILLHQIINSNSEKSKASLPEKVMPEVVSTIKFELLQQLEQTISQLLNQKTSIRLNQELNQPIQINLSIPLQVDDKTTALKLHIKQRQSNDPDEQNHWEINLSFEFALLGLISTNILLQDNKLSAHFWAVKITTKELIETHMNQFKNQLKKTGFELGLFDCFVGKPVIKDENIETVVENLVDVNV